MSDVPVIQSIAPVCQIVDKGFYPLGPPFTFRVFPNLMIDEVEYQMETKIGRYTQVNVHRGPGERACTLWKLSTPWPIAGKDKRVAVERRLEVVRRDQRPLEELDESFRISRYFNESLPEGHLHLQLAISGVDGVNAF